jgi:hypothetical protein
MVKIRLKAATSGAVISAAIPHAVKQKISATNSKIMFL